MQFKLTSVTVLLCLSLAHSGQVHAQIYKTIDKDGNVVFTDVPPNDDTDAVKLDTYNTYTPEPLSPAAAAPQADTTEDETDEPASTAYDLLRITSPQADEPIRDNAGNLTVTVTTEPALDTSAGDTLQILLDGTLMVEGSSSTVSLTNVDRGTHQLSAQIRNDAGEVLAESQPIEFHMLRFSALMNPNRKNSSQ